MSGKNARKLNNPLGFARLPDIGIDPQVKKGIFIIFIVLVGALSLLGLFGLGGLVGGYLSQIMMLAFGWGKWIFPVVLLALGVIFYGEDRYKVKGANYFGLFLFVVSAQSLFHLLIDESQWRETIASGSGGGYVGLFLVTGFVKLLGFWGAALAVFALLMISFMLLFNTTLYELIGRNSWPAKLILHPLAFIYSQLFGRNGREDEVSEEAYTDEEIAEPEEAEEDLHFKKKKIRDPKPVAAAIEETAAEEKAALSARAAAAGKMEEKIFKPSRVQIDIPLDLLSGKVGKPTSGDIKGNAEIIKRTLENFGIPVEMGDVSVGPTVTQYTFKPAEGVKLSRITTLNNDLALSLAAHPIRIEAPIPGKSLVGIEVPNQSKAVVGLKEILSDESFKGRKSNTLIALGKDVAGKVWLDDLAKMPHLLVAGATNSGKSVCLNAIIVSLLYQNNPDDLKFIMVDPKKVEMHFYNRIPHLLTPVITDVSKTINALKWCLNEMDRRFEILAKVGKRNIQTYNLAAPNGEKMPYIVFVIDELADLMVVAARDVEPNIIRLAQMARAVGIHLILATQRPSVNVITGVIKANMPARIAFSVASGIDSRTILDSLGAEKLLGRGDMLFSTAETPKPRRLQGAFVSEGEIKKIVDYIKEKSGEPNYIEGITERQKVSGIGGVGIDGASDDDDELLNEAREMVINSGKASASYLQRRLSIGYARAARLLDLLEEAGVVGPANGSKPREILVSKEQYEAMAATSVSGVSLHNREEAVAPAAYLASDSSESDSAPESSPNREGAEMTDDFEEEILADEEISEEVEEIKKEDDTPVHAIAADSAVAGNVAEDDDDDGKYFAR